MTIVNSKLYYSPYLRSYNFFIMVILFFSIYLGWVLASITIELVNFILAKFVNPIPWQLKVLSIFIGGLLVIIVISMIPSDFTNHTIDVYCSGNEESHNPYLITVSNEHLGVNFSFDPRKITDVLLLGTVGKITLSTIKGAPASVKASVAASTVLSMGTVAVMLKAFNNVSNQSKVYEISKNNQKVQLEISLNIEKGGSFKDVEEVAKVPPRGVLAPFGAKYISINSPFEYLYFVETLKVIILCMEILTILSIIGFILFALFMSFTYSGINNFDKTNNILLKKLINLTQKSGKVYALIWGTLTLFNLSWILYFTIKFIELLNNL